MNYPKLLEFARRAYAKRGPSHDFNHATRVMNLAVEIFEATIIETFRPSYFLNIVKGCALLHDAYDHKYDPDGSLRKETVAFFESSFFVEKDDFWPALPIVIDYISYSKQNKMGRQAFRNELRDKLRACGVPDILIGSFMHVRDCVSDADKIDALGRVGYERCKEYIAETWPEHDATTVQAMVETHAAEKLLRLRDEFIETRAGKQLAAIAHDEFLSAMRQ